jgi:hypothetical protein
LGNLWQDPRAALKAWRNKMLTTIQPEAEQTEQRMSLSDLSRTPEFNQLSLKMEKFVAIYLQSLISTGTADVLAAVKGARYNCKSDQNARILGFQLLANPKIVLVLNRFFGVTPTEAFRKQVQKAISNKKLSVAQVRALELYSNINGFEKTAVGVVSKAVSDKNHGHEDEPATVTAQRFSVGDICVQDGQRFRITSVDLNGAALTAEPTL